MLRVATASGLLRSSLSRAVFVPVARLSRPAKCRRKTGPAGAADFGVGAAGGFSRQAINNTAQHSSRVRASRLIGVFQLPKGGGVSKRKHFESAMEKNAEAAAVSRMRLSNVKLAVPRGAL